MDKPATTKPERPTGEQLGLKKDAAGNVRLFAKRMGFRDSSIVKAGSVFLYPADKRLPKWAVPADAPDAVVDGTGVAADTRPVAAVKASKKKAAEMNEAT